MNVALGVSGSIAAVKVVELAHELRRRGASVRAVMTGSAQNIVHPWAVQFATDNPVITDITGQVEHVELCGTDGWADVLLLSPATANTLGKIAAAVDDTPVTTCTTTALGAGTPVVVAPAMHEPMYDHPGVLDAIERVESWGVSFVEPRVEEGKAKIADENSIILATARSAGSNPLNGKRVVVTSGATSEAIDPVRVLTSRASGQTGRAVAAGCYARGADVTLVHDGQAIPWADTRQAKSASEMLVETRDACENADAFVSAAAVSDYTVKPREEKIRSGQNLTLEFESTPKIINEVRDAYPTLPIVGFKAETSGDDAMIDAARELIDRVDAAFVIGNDANVMGENGTRAFLVTDDGTTGYEGDKQGLGLLIADELAEIL